MVFELRIVFLLFRLLVLVWCLRFGVLLLSQVVVWGLCLRCGFVGGLRMVWLYYCDLMLIIIWWIVLIWVFIGAVARLRWVCIMACMGLLADLLFDVWLCLASGLVCIVMVELVVDWGC